MKNNICLVGNSFIDEIIEVHNIKKNLSNNIHSRKKCFGGIFNNLSAINIKNFNKIYLITKIPNLFLENKYYLRNRKKIFFNQKENYVNKATIIIEKKKSTRTSFVFWTKNKLSIILPKINFQWINISYLDKITNISLEKIRFLKKKTQFLSCDLCSDDFFYKKNIVKMLRLFDFIFISNSIYKSFFLKKDIIQKNQYLIIHSDNYIILISKKKITFRFKKIKNLNTNGAGDFLLSIFMQQIIANKKINLKFLKNCHKKVCKFLIKRQTQINVL